MDAHELAAQLQRIMGDYEARGREPQRVLEMIACLLREHHDCPGLPLKPVEQIKLVVQIWERGDRLDLDALESICALTRQLQG
jgi:hypothetical protein